jgi:hypothetical protein
MQGSTAAWVFEVLLYSKFKKKMAIALLQNRGETNCLGFSPLCQEPWSTGFLKVEAHS